jgi:hypothetical protein
VTFQNDEEKRAEELTIVTKSLLFKMMRKEKFAAEKKSVQ